MGFGFGKIIWVSSQGFRKEMGVKLGAKNVFPFKNFFFKYFFVFVSFLLSSSSVLFIFIVFS